MPPPPRALTLRPWRGHAALRALEPRWRELHEASAADRLCNGPDWTLPYAEAFVEDADAFGWTVEDGSGSLVALLNLWREPARGRMALRRALLLGDGTFDSDYLEPLVRPGSAAEVVPLLLDALSGERSLQVAVFAGLPASSPWLPHLCDELERRGLPRRERPQECLATSLPASFEEFVAARKSRVRSKIRSAMRTAREAGASLHWCDSAKELSAHLTGLFQLHAQRWSEVGQAGAFAESRRRAFYESFAPRLLERGALRLARLDWEGRPVAYQLGALLDGTYYQIQEGFHPDRADVRAGTALRGMALERLIEEGARRYDFMAGDSRHKREWGGEPRPCTTIAFALPRLRARLSYGLRAWMDRRRS